MSLKFKLPFAAVMAALILAVSASHCMAVSLWTYNFGHFTPSLNIIATDWANQQAAVGEAWTVQGGSSHGAAWGNIVANPYAANPVNVLQSQWPSGGGSTHVKAWHGYATGGSGSVTGGIQPYITDMATADLVKYTFDVQTGTYSSGSGNRIQWEVGAFTAPGNRAANGVFQLGYYDPFLSSAFAASGALNWRLVTPAGTFTSTTKPFFHLEHLLVDVLVDLNASTASVFFNNVADASLQNISLGAVDPRLADEIYFDSHGGQVVSLRVETLNLTAAVPEPASLWLAGIGVTCAALSLALRRPRS